MYTNRYEILSWMVEIWVKKHLVSESLQLCDSIMPKFFLQGTTNIARFTFSVVTRTVYMSKTNRIGDTKYNI